MIDHSVSNITDCSLITGEPSHLHLFNDDEKLIWRVTSDSDRIQTCDTMILFFHVFVLFLCHLLSAWSIIFMASHHQATVLRKQSDGRELGEELIKHAYHILISPLLLVILFLPHLIISLLPQCLEAYENACLY